MKLAGSASRLSGPWCPEGEMLLMRRAEMRLVRGSLGPTALMTWADAFAVGVVFGLLDPWVREL